MSGLPPHIPIAHITYKMSLSPEEIQGLTDTVGIWRMQEVSANFIRPPRNH